MGKALMDAQITPVHLIQPLYKHIMGWPVILHIKTTVGVVHETNVMFCMYVMYVCRLPFGIWNTSTIRCIGTWPSCWTSMMWVCCTWSSSSQKTS